MENLNNSVSQPKKPKGAAHQKAREKILIKGLKILSITTLMSISIVQAREEQGYDGRHERAPLTASQQADGACIRADREAQREEYRLYQEWKRHATIADLNDLEAYPAWHSANTAHLKAFHSADVNYQREACAARFERDQGVTKGTGESTLHSWGSIFE